MKKQTLILTIGLLIVYCPVHAVDLYVSPLGSDTHPGGKHAPLASLEGARALIASKKLAGREPVTVWVQGGTYRLAQPFKLGAKDAGT